jgi:hypothetical protein
MMQPLLTPTPRATRLIPPEECWRAMSRRASTRGSRRSATSGPAASFPALPGNLISHFDFSQAGTVTSAANKASAVSNLAGAGSGLSQGVGASQPGYGLTTQNGRNTLDCTGSTFMSGTIPSSVGNFTFQAVIKSGASVAAAYGIGGSDVAAVVYQINAGALRAVDYTVTPTGMAFSDLTILANTWHVVTYRRTGSTFDAFLDGTKTTNPGTSTATALGTGWLLGTDDPSNFDPFTGQFGETLLYNVALSDANILANRAALKALWGTP